MELISGTQLANQMKKDYAHEVKALVEQGYRAPKLAVILVGEDPASQIYVRNKEKACAKVGIESLSIRKDASLTEAELLDMIDALNEDDGVDGILVQLPLPKHIDENKVIERISPLKDVDGFHPTNMANLVLGKEGFVPCTPLGVMKMLESIQLDLTGKEVVVVGRSHNVGLAAAILALAKNATVTIAHSRTKNLKEVVKRADVIIAAVGRAKLITADMVKEGAVIVDVGINRQEDGKICGDVDFENVAPLTSYISPVPGGVGPMTIACLMYNTLISYRKRVIK